MYRIVNAGSATYLLAMLYNVASSIHGILLTIQWSWSLSIIINSTDVYLQNYVEKVSINFHFSSKTDRNNITDENKHWFHELEMLSDCDRRHSDVTQRCIIRDHINRTGMQIIPVEIDGFFFFFFNIKKCGEQLQRTELRHQHQSS